MQRWIYMAWSAPKLPNIPGVKKLALASDELPLNIEGERAVTILKTLIVLAALLLVAAIVFVTLRFVIQKARALLARAAMRRDLAKSSQQEPEPKQAHSDLVQAFEHAKRELSTSAMGERALRGLPWYLLIGPPESGKSTLLRESGMTFPYLKASARGVPDAREGGTDHCDWWVSDQGVILDTAGQYTDRDADPEAWRSLLDSITKLRPATPINGILLNVSLEEFLDEEGKAHAQRPYADLARRLRSRLYAIYENLGKRMPVYIVVSKLDRLAGFEELMSHLPKSAQQKALGVTLELDSPVSNHQTRLAKSFDGLCERVYELAFRSVARSKDCERVEEVYSFPKRFLELRTSFLEFCNTFFQVEGNEEPLLLRGIYFASASSRHEPLEQLMRARGRMPVIDRSQDPLGQPSSLFLRGLFYDLVFPDRLFVRSSARAHKEQQRHQTVWTTAMASLALAVFVVPCNSATRFEMLEREAVSQTHQLQMQYRSLPDYRSREAVQNYSAIATLESRLQSPVEAKVAGSYWGMNKTDTLKPAYAKLVDRVLDSWCLDWIHDLVQQDASLLDSAVYAYQDKAQDLRGGELALVYNALGRYLLLTRTGTTKARTQEQKAWLNQRLVIDLQELTRAHQLQHRHLGRDGALAQRLAATVVERDSLRVKGSPRLKQRALKLLRDVERAQFPLSVSRIVNDINAQHRSQRYTLTSFTDKLDRGFLQASGTKNFVPSAYTREGWESFVRPRLNQEAEHPGYLQSEQYPELPPLWIRGLGTREAWSKRRENSLRRIYQQRYETAWASFLRSLSIQEHHDEAALLTMLEKLSDSSSSPFYTLLKDLADNAQLLKIAVVHEDVSTQDEETAPNDEPTAAKKKRDTLDLRRLRSLANFGSVQEGESSDRELPLDAFTAIVGELKGAMTQQGTHPNPQELLRETQTSARRRVRQLINEQDSSWHQVLVALLETPIDLAHGFSSKQHSQSLQRLWCTNVVQAYQRKIHGKYPFSKSAQDKAEVDLVDLATFFHPKDGDLWKLLEPFQAYLTKRGNRFVAVDHGLDTKHQISPAVLTFLNRSWMISQALFKGEGQEPHLRFEVTAPARSGIQQLSLSVGDRIYSQENGPEETESFVWPNSEGSPTAKLAAWFSPYAKRHATASNARTLPPRLSPNNLKIVKHGPWAIFKLIDASASVDKIEEYRFVLSWEPENKLVDPPVTLEFHSPSGIKAFFGDPRRKESMMEIFRHPSMKRPPQMAFVNGIGCDL